MKGINREFFKNPTTDPDYSVSGFWFWNDNITDDKTTEQLEMMKHIAANQPVVHSRSGLVNEYLSEDWFERIQNVINVCKKNEQKIWLYDENNWPSGNCSWTITMEEENREHFLQFDQWQLKKNEIFHKEETSKKYLCLKAYQGEREMDLLSLDENHITMQADTEIYGVYVDVDDYEPVGKFNVDYLSKEAIRLFLDSTHEKYRAHFENDFGKIISGIFMDETRFCNTMPWTKNLPQEFINRKGYDIIPYLPLLKRKAKDSAKVRFDYYDVISDMYTEATFKQVDDWCRKYQMKTIGHFLGEETLATQSYFGADMMRGYKYFAVPGIDHLGNGIGSLDGKFAVSACYNYGKDRIVCESFGASGWDMTFENMVKVSNWLFQQGINMIIMHGFYYSIRDERSKDFPPSYFYQWKYWDYMPMYVKMANRMMEMLSDGQAEAEILVYAPIETFWKYFEPDLDTKTGFWEEGPWIEDENAKFIDNQFQLLCNGLTDENLDYTILGSDAVENFVVEGQELVNKLSGQRFRVLVLPMVELLTEETVQLINKFIEAGGKVINYRSENIEIVSKSGKHMRGEDMEKLQIEELMTVLKIRDIIEVCRKNLNLPFEVLCGVDRVSHTKSSYPARLIDPYIHDGEQLFGVGITRYLKKNNRIFNVTNYNDKDEDLLMWVKSSKEPELFIPETGEIITVDGKKVDGGYNINFTIPKNRTFFIVCEGI